MIKDEATLRATMTHHVTETGCTNCKDCSTIRMLLGVIDAERLQKAHVLELSEEEAKVYDDKFSAVADFCLRVAKDPKSLEQLTIGHFSPDDYAMFERAYVAKCVLQRMGYDFA